MTTLEKTRAVYKSQCEICYFKDIYLFKYFTLLPSCVLPVALFRWKSSKAVWRKFFNRPSRRAGINSNFNLLINGGINKK